jgi:hypothetical protein
MKARFLSAERMTELESDTVISGSIDASGNLILTTKGGNVVNAGSVRGADATALLQVIDSATVDLTLTGAGTPASPWQLSASVALASGAETIAGTNAARAVTPFSLKALFDAGVSALKSRLTSVTDVSLTSTNHAFQIGPDNGLNLAMDQNEIMARNNGAAAGLTLNAEGGDMTIGHSSSIITIPGHLALSGSSRVLFNGPPAFMNDTQTVTLSEKVSDQANGIVLCWSYYSAGAAQNHTWTYDFVPKWHVINRPGEGIVFLAPQFTGNPATPGGVVTKYCYVGDTSITGNAANDDNLGATRVIRAVIGV